MSARTPQLWRPPSFFVLLLIMGILLPTETRAFSLSPTSSFLPFATPSTPPAQILLLNLILLTNHANMPSSSTIFLPLNQSIAMAFPSSHALDTVSYHIAVARLAYKDLLSLHSSPSMLPSLLHGRRIRVSRSDKSLLVDEQEIVAPDLYFDDYVVVHGIACALDPDFYMSQSSSAAARISPIPDP